MQHSSMELFCDECGLANDSTATHCAGCQYPLAHTASTLDMQPVTPVRVVHSLLPAREVTAGRLLVPTTQGARIRPRSYPECSFQPGSLLAGRYRIGEVIGTGGFSTVYRAVDQEVGYNDRLVAIKRIQLDQLTPRQIIDATGTFNREVFMLARFKSINGIPAYYEHLTDAKNWYLITQYIAGQTLEDYLQKAPGGYLAEKETLELGLALVDLMQTLHNCEPPVIFRDLKPSNIMLTPEKKCFLIDFGIARTFTPDKKKDTTPLGSPGYAPPEQYGSAQTDARSDIYSLGATLQTLLTGRDPLELSSGEALHNPQPPSSGLRKLLDVMLSADPAARPPDMARVKKHLEYILHRPVAIYLLGVVFGTAVGIVYGICWLISFLLPGASSLQSFSYIIGIFLAAYVEMQLSKKLGLPKKTPDGFRRFWFLGVLTVGAFYAIVHFLLFQFLW